MTYRPAFYELVIIRSIDTALSAPHPHPVRPYWWRVWWLGHVWLCSVAQQVQMTLRVSTTEDNTLLCGNRLPVCVWKYFLCSPVRTLQPRERIYHTWIALLLVCGTLFIWRNPLKHELHLNNVQDAWREAHCIPAKLQRPLRVFKRNDLCVPWESLDSDGAKLMIWRT